MAKVSGKSGSFEGWKEQGAVLMCSAASWSAVEFNVCSTLLFGPE
jgi:hypothetical protein